MNTTLDVQNLLMDTQGDVIMTEAGLDENQAVNDDQALPDVNQNVLEGERLRCSADLNPQGSPGRYAYTRASRWDILPFLDVGDAKYQSMLEENRLLRMRNEDLEEADKLKNEVISGLNEAIGILNEVIRVYVRI
ncbi:hypothetical protein KC19_1G232400 [Ceratodon purpureus]|uniref:Uncharacterized protein n=1 Tax=Ceratodon purpureus TaxID=3225 RepID=A0A8T0JBV2_CERPU|nr:hypothetical protein KC19_1G232400 [Ceratodon purpureus]